MRGANTCIAQKRARAGFFSGPHDLRIVMKIDVEVIEMNAPNVNAGVNATDV